MRWAVFKEALVVGLSTAIIGFAVKKITKQFPDQEIPDIAIFFGIGVLTHLAWEIVGGNRWYVENVKFPPKKEPKALSGLKRSIPEDDPDLKIALDVEGNIHPDIKQLKTKVMGPEWCQIYGVRFFKKRWCDAVVRLAEKYGDWDSKAKGDGYSAGMTLPIDFVPEVQKRYSEAVKKYLFPCARKLFPTFNPTHHDEVYVLRYIAGKKDQDEMDHHYDAEPLACILGMNDEFTGGGTHFPQFKLTVVANPGVMLLYPGGLSHLHGGKKIDSGRRYAILHALYDKVLNGENVSVWEDGEPQHDRDTPPSRG